MTSLPATVRDAYGLDADAAPLGSGLINDTFLGRLNGDAVVVQRVHTIFAASVHLDIEAVTRHLARRGVTTPLLVRTRGGELSTLDDDGRVWRVLTYLDGRSFDRFPSLSHVREAGALVGRFHAAVADLEHAYAFTRPGVHDLSFRMNACGTALASHREHRLRADVAASYVEATALAARAVPLGATPSRHAHGDLKAANLLFQGDRGLALVDLDTVASMMWIFELGDALRSWCNRGAEDDDASALDASTFEAALSGYATTAPASPAEEVALLPRGVLTIALELAVRFMTDALDERYFGFDAARYATRGDHNLARARAQLALARSIDGSLAELERVAARVLDPRR